MNERNLVALVKKKFEREFNSTGKIVLTQAGNSNAEETMRKFRQDALDPNNLRNLDVTFVSLKLPSIRGHRNRSPFYRNAY